MQIDIAPYYNELIRKEIATGKFNNEVEVIQAGLALLEKEQTHFAILTKALQDGQQSGFSAVFDNTAFKKKMEDKYASK